MQRNVKKIAGVLTNSEKRSKIVLMLLKRPMSSRELSIHLGSSSSNVIPQIRKLELESLVELRRRTYTLTERGKLIGELYSGFLCGIEVIENHKPFWTEHDHSCIPERLLKRIYELGGSHIIENSPEDIYEIHKEFVENIVSSTSIYGISSVYHPAYPPMFLELAERGKNVTLILTENVFKKVKKNNRSDLRGYLGLKNAAMYVSDEDIKLASVVTDRFFSISLYFKDGTYDFKRDFISFNETALLWGKELFEYYQNISRKINIQKTFGKLPPV